MSSVVLAIIKISEQTMEQYLGQFLGNLVTSFQGGNFSSTLVSGFIYLSIFTILAYLVFRIALIALKVGTIAGVLALIVSMGMPNTDLANANPNPSHNNNEPRAPEINLPDFSQYLSEEKLREIFLSVIVGAQTGQGKTKGFQK